MILVSACLAGVQCAYDGKDRKSEIICNLMKFQKLVLVCPEQLGGLPTPREKAEIQKNRQVLSINGIDVTNNFQKGALECLKMYKSNGCTSAILKSNSPSCGNKTIYDGSFSNKIIVGEGITVRLLRENKIKIFNEKELDSETIKFILSLNR